MAPPMQMNPAMDRRVAPPQGPQQRSGAPQGDIGQLFQVLKESPYPAQREWAANNLATFDGRAHPEIVAILLDCAKQDPAATVRAGCVYSLSRMGLANDAVAGTMQMLRQDSDPRVRQEVEQAMARMGLTPNR